MGVVVRGRLLVSVPWFVIVDHTVEHRDIDESPHRMHLSYIIPTRQHQLYTTPPICPSLLIISMIFIIMIIILILPTPTIAFVVGAVFVFDVAVQHRTYPFDAHRYFIPPTRSLKLLQRKQ